MTSQALVPTAAVQVGGFVMGFPSPSNAVTVYPETVAPFVLPGLQLTLTLLSPASGVLIIGASGAAAGVTELDGDE